MELGVDRRQQHRVFTTPDTRKTPLVASARRIKAIRWNAPNSSCTLIRRSGRKICLIAVKQRKRLTVKQWKAPGTGRAWVKAASIPRYCWDLSSEVECFDQPSPPHANGHSDSPSRCLLIHSKKTLMVLVCHQSLASHLSHLTFWKG